MRPLTLGLAATAANARNCMGSDTLRVFTQTLVAPCGALGGGTTYPDLGPPLTTT